MSSGSVAGTRSKLQLYMAKRAVISPFLSTDEKEDKTNKPKERPDVRGQVGYYRELAGVDVPSDDEVRYIAIYTDIYIYIYNYLAS